MGCQISSDGNFETPPNYEEFWNQRKHRNQVVRQNNSQRKGWKIVRILVVSTYKDFKNERSAVLSMIERQIQPVAAEKLIFLQVEDLAYGSKNYIDEIANIYLIAKCCCDDNKIAIYCHFLGECAGFVIDSTFSDESFLQQNEIKYGQTFSETFLQLNAVDSNNSLFLHRNPDFLYELPFNVTNFVDPQKGRERAQHFAQSVKKHVKPASLLEYSVKTSGINNTHFKQILFDDLSKATDPLRSLIDSFIEKFPYSEDIKTLTVNQKIRDFYQNSSSKRISNILQKINSNIKNHRNTVIFGDYSTGKTTILYKILKEHGSAVFIKAEEGMNIRQELERKLGMFIQEIDEPKIRHLILIDDIHNLSTDLSSYTHLTIIGTSRKKKISLSNPQFIEIPSQEPENIQELLSKFTSSESKATNILRFARERRRKSLGSIEEGSNEPNWNDLKIRIIGTMGKFGSSEQKCGQLIYYKTLSVVEADVCLMESDSRGHLLIAVLCFLTIQQNGLNEIDLRRLLADEHALLPMGIRRNYRNLPFDYCAECYGHTNPQILPIRWYYIINRIGHLLIAIDSDDNHFLIPAACQRIIRKKFLTKPVHLEHFQKLLTSFYSTKEKL